MIMQQGKGPKVPPVHDSEPPRSANEFPGLERLDRSELDELDEDDWDALEAWQDKTGVLRKTRPDAAQPLALPRSA